MLKFQRQYKSNPVIEYMATYRLRIVGTVLLAAVAIRAGAQTNSDPLRLVLACEEASTPTFRLTIQNVSAGPTAAIIGTVINRWYILDHVSFALSRRGVPDISFDYSDPSMPPAIAANLGPWVIQLPPATSYSVLAPVKGRSGWFAKPAQVHATLTTESIGAMYSGMQDLALLHPWVGTLTSDRINFPKACRSGK
jgi:hypothetical protein